jgi:hypothetical protein
MTRQERRALERRQKQLGNFIKMTGVQKLQSAGFFYKGAGVTVQDPQSLINEYELAIDGYRDAIEKDPNELVELYNQLEQCLPMIDNNTIDNQSSIIWMMNIYCLTKLGHMKDDNMNGLQYTYVR